MSSPRDLDLLLAFLGATVAIGGIFLVLCLCESGGQRCARTLHRWRERRRRRRLQREVIQAKPESDSRSSIVQFKRIHNKG